MNLSTIVYTRDIKQDGSHLSPLARKRLTKEAALWVQKQEQYARLGFHLVSNERLWQWIVQMDCAPDSIYAGESYSILLVFDSTYPFNCPYVVFLGKVPKHEHVYSNGHICLSTLSSDWSPCLTVEGVLLSLQSMLSSAKRKMEPPGNEAYSRTHATSLPSRTDWLFHDDTA